MSWIDEQKEKSKQAHGRPCKFNTTAQKEEYNDLMHIDFNASFEFRRDAVNKQAKHKRVKKSY